MTVNFATEQPGDISIETSRASKAAHRIGLPIGLCIVHLVLAYEWLGSGINKLLNPNFAVQLVSTLYQNVNGNPYSWYASSLRQIVLSHASLFGVLTELGQVAIGITLVVTTALWWRPEKHGQVVVGKAA